MSEQDTDSYHYHGEIDAPEPTKEDGTLLASPNWVINTVRALTAEPTEPDAGVMDLLTDRDSVKQEAKKCDLPTSDAEDALDEAIETGRVFAAPKYGHLAPMDDAHLLAVTEAELAAAEDGEPNVPDGEEQVSGYPRQDFIGKCNQARDLIQEREGQAVDPLEVADD